MQLQPAGDRPEEYPTYRLPILARQRRVWPTNCFMRSRLQRQTIDRDTPLTRHILHFWGYLSDHVKLSPFNDTLILC